MTRGKAWRKQTPEQFAQSFWARVDKTSACWTWTGARMPTGYGMVRWLGKTMLTHRVSFGLAFGNLDPNLEVCHRCDNPPCVRPDHLFLGDHAANAHDMLSKGRHRTRSPVGENHGSAKLTSEYVKTIRAQHAKKGTLALAKEFSVSTSTIQNIVAGRSWRSV